MRPLQRVGKVFALLATFAVSSYLALQLKGGGLWDGLAPAIAANANSAQAGKNYDLRQVRVVNDVLRKIRDRYVDPKRIKPKDMLLSALNMVQREAAQIIVLHEENAPTVKVRVDTQEKEFRVDNVLGPWDVSARLSEIFAFMQDGLREADVNLRDVEYAACNGLLRTLDPHSVLLSPEAYKEMNLTTSGQFGGLGIVISIRDQQLTVMNPMPGTPAGRAGIKKLDRIVKINGESTLNMGINEAVQHLRGAPGTKVTVWIRRDGPEGWKDPKPFELVREIIKVVSVEHRLLDGNIGYVKIKQFQANTMTDLDAALTSLKKGGELKGLIVDLRWNPGGLLDQAARVADRFLVEGPIVATVGSPSEGRDEKLAHPDGTEPNYPIALLVNGQSASASEIVAGAMKNHDRAIVVGDTTFGKGSVQLVFNDLPDGAALKLTIAQYLTEPGDVSIQGTGVTPDIELDPMTVDLQEMDLTVDTGMIKERDLSRSLSNVRARESKPLETLRYNLPQRDRQELREKGEDADEGFSLDSAMRFPVRFARDLLARVPQGKRMDQVRHARGYIHEARMAELAKASAELTQLGVDWADAPADVPNAAPTPTVPPGVEVKVETDRPNNEVLAGEPLQLRVTVTNKGKTPLYRLYGVTKSDNPMFDQKELAFGKLDVGKSKTATVPLGWCEVEGRKVGSTAPLPKDAPRTCRIPRDTLTRSDGITIRFEEARSRAPAPVQALVGIKSLERPTFAYSLQIADNRKGNGDGRVQKGEALTMFVAIKNVGRGRAYETQANLRNLSGDGLLLREGRFDISNMQPGEMRRVAFTFDVESRLAENEAKIELSIADRDLRETVVEKVRIPIASPSPIAPGQGAVRAKPSGAPLLESPDPGARQFGRLPPGSSVALLGTSGDYTKVNLGDGRTAFVRNAEVEPTGAAAGAVSFEDAMQHHPPTIDLGSVALSTRDASTNIKATAMDTERLLDAYIFVGSRKVFYRSNRNGQDPKRMGIDASLPLRPGVNVVTIMARENTEAVGRKTFIIRRDGPNGELLPTPKVDEDLGEAASMVDDE